MATVNPYEVIVRLRDKRNDKTQMLTRLEYAYSPADAVMQAIMNAASQLNVAGDYFTVETTQHVGPPERMRLAAAQLYETELRKVMASIKQSLLQLEKGDTE